MMDSISDLASEREDDSGIDSNADSGDGHIYIRVSVPELKLQKCLQFSQEDSVWMAKQRVLSTLAKDLRDGLNYGLYCPPMNGKAGKFLDEERPLKDYPLPGPIGFLEFKYKRRVYKLMQINPKKLKQIHTKANLKLFMDMIKRREVDKILKTVNKGLDPNFHDHEAGETPLTFACTIEKPREVILTLFNGGAHLDFRNKAGLTPLHRAAQSSNYAAIKTLLDLSASPNYKNPNGVTPLYLCVASNTSAQCAEILLHDHAVVGIVDDKGWAECHHACSNGRVQHLEHLMFYGADFNQQNSSGNSPLHVCAANNQEACARLLLFRGADKTIQNFANQDAYQVAIIAGNYELASVIENFSSDQVVQFQELPKYNDKRRTTISAATLNTLRRTRSDPRLNILFQQDLFKPPSPSMSNNSAPHFTSSASLFSREPAGSMVTSPMYMSSHCKEVYDSDSPRSMSISSGGSVSGSQSCDILFRDDHDNRCFWPPERPRSVFSSACSPPPPSSHCCPASLSPHQRAFICVKDFKSRCQESELALRRGQFVEVLSIGEETFGEVSDPTVGSARQQHGRFLRDHVQETNMRNTRLNSCTGTKTISDEDSIVIRRDTFMALTSPDGEYVPRTVVLQKARTGFGFVLRGAKSQGQQSGMSTLDFSPSPDFPALQYLDKVDKTSMADRAGLKQGDFLLEINGESVVNATHEHTVRLIKESGDTLAMKVVTVRPGNREGLDPHMDGTMTLPIKKKKAPRPPMRNPHTSLTPAFRKHAQTVLDSLTELEKLDNSLNKYDTESLGSPYSAAPYSEAYLNKMAAEKGVDPSSKTASIRSRQFKRLSSAPLEGAFGTPVEFDADSPVLRGNQEPKYGQHVARVELDEPVPTPNQRKTSNQTRPLPQQHSVTNVRLSSAQLRDRVTYEGSERIYAVPFREEDELQGRNIPPPPSHAPPKPPEDIVAINTHSPHMYANISEEIQLQKKEESPYESSFRPGTNARLSQDPDVLNKMAMKALAPVPPVPSASASKTYSAPAHENHYAEPKPDYEPEPDYDPTDEPVVHKLTPPSSHSTPKTSREEDYSMSAFGSAIRMAAVAREKRAQDTEERVVTAPPKAPPKTPPKAPPPPTQLPPPTTNVPPPPPNAPPPPPPSAPLVKRQFAPSPQGPQSQAPRPQRASEPRQDGAHAAILEAVRKRRTVMDDANMTQVADSIENRIQRGKKLQTTVVYKSDKTKAEAKNTSVAAPVLASSRSAEKTNPKQMDRASTLSTASSTDFMALAEKARMDYIKKRSDSDTGEDTLKRQVSPPASDAGRPKPPPAATKTPVAPSPTAGVANLASVIAQKAARRDHTNNNALHKINQPSGMRILGATTGVSGTETPRNTQRNGRLPQQSASSPVPNGHIDVSSLVVPPPPSFDSEVIASPALPPPQFEGEGELGEYTDFIPPPMGFDSVEPPVNAHKPFQDKPVEAWQVSDVKDWLHSLQLSDHSPRFVSSSVNGQRLVQLGYSELIDLGVRQVDDRMTIQRAIKQALTMH